MTETSREDFKILQEIAMAANDKKAKRVTAMNLKNISDLCDYAFICSGDNSTQTQAIANAVQEVLKAKFDMIPKIVEGADEGHWILIDYGYIIVHIFYDYIRNYYGLERLWTDAVFMNLSKSE